MRANVLRLRLVGDGHLARPFLGFGTPRLRG